ncbi:hypothetical protein Rsub_08761 [Raphidocelis subcapitata]|uniref:Uncharacterized protein n=1 Tax=Raphidocelis subcapitata TaxID=307507 RepID=A0A2V0P8P2_9CHLO|nr:hypothetical protein Rsub_08761 [Raphidocelis subcapitata]|eukprot:GBF96216.1 hypothetical protein Rsub_08761 [Raphidocelis subcapitata]
MGQGHEVLASLHGNTAGTADEECERELEKEEEQEVERELPAMKPRREVEWNYAAAAAARAPGDLCAAAGLQPLASAVSEQLRLVPAELASLCWPGSLWATGNFLAAVEMEAGTAANNYLRAPEAVLALPSGDIVLLSEREPNGRALELRDPSPTLSSGAAARLAGRGAAGGAAAGAVAAARLWGGATRFDRRGEVFGELCGLVAGHKAPVEALLSARAVSERLARRDLEAACEAAAPRAA